MIWVIWVSRPGSRAGAGPGAAQAGRLDLGWHRRRLRLNRTVCQSYLSEGLRVGDKCVCVVDGAKSESVVASLGAEVDLAPRLDRRQLDVLWSQEAYLSGGRFSTEAMLDFWDRSRATP